MDFFNMCRQSTGLGEAPVTDVTTMGFFSSVSSHVQLQVPRTFEPLCAKTTLLHFLACHNKTKNYLSHTDHTDVVKTL